ncbi:MAG TPA: FecR family protein, partial [Rhodocyclaceae bacterium]|nr:FecR family protein [Rhodocyclaceae bacterium]
MTSQFRLKNHVLLMALAAVYPVTGYTAGAARIEFAAGSVVAITSSGGQRALGKGSELESGETVRTGDGARAQLKFSDGAMMSLQPQTEFRIDEYKFNGKTDGEERGFFSLIRGGLRTISGLVGKGKRDNYRVSTAVATIGIRGTEYSAVFTGGTNGNLNLSTGEGAVEICNSGGCVIISSGESAVVTGVTPPKRTEVRPSLPPATTSTPAAVVYSTSDDRNSGGGSTLLGKDLVSGPDYMIAWLATSGGYVQNPHKELASSATFDPGSKLINFDAPSGNYRDAVVTSAFSIDGVIGWGIWSSGGYSSYIPVTSLHYVVGTPTSTSDLNNLSGMDATYRMVGYTAPTSSDGYAVTGLTSDLTAHFSSSSVDVNMAMKVNNTPMSFSVSGS